MRTLFTLGYEQRTIEEFVRMLEDAGVGVLVDVRETPWSHKPGFSKRGLAEHLEAAGIEYVHAGIQSACGAGPSQAPRRSSCTPRISRPGPGLSINWTSSWGRTSTRASRSA